MEVFSKLFGIKTIDVHSVGVGSTRANVYRDIYSSIDNSFGSLSSCNSNNVDCSGILGMNEWSNAAREISNRFKSTLEHTNDPSLFTSTSTSRMTYEHIRYAFIH